MRKVLFIIAMPVIATLSFSGCVGNTPSVETSTVGSTVQEFKIGTVIKTKKVLINERGLTALKGAGVGAAGGAIISRKNRGKGAAIGAAIGAIGGAIIGHEVVAYETAILDNETKNIYTSFLEVEFRKGTVVDYILSSDKKSIKTVNFLAYPKAAR